VQVHRRRIKVAAAAAELVNFHLRSASETFLAIVIAVAGSRLAVAEPGDAKIQLTQTIALPGVERQMDYFDFDAAGGSVPVLTLRFSRSNMSRKREHQLPRKGYFKIPCSRCREDLLGIERSS